MADLTGQTVASTYNLLLKVDTGGIDGTMRAIEGGTGSPSGLMLSTGGVKAAGTFEATGVSTLTGAVTATGGVVGDLTGDVTGNADTATKAYVTDNESTDEENLIPFVADAATASGNHGLEMDGNLAYNPSTGTITSTAIASNLTGNVTGNVTGDLTGAVTATGTLAAGVTATTQAFSDDSTKVATTAFVEAAVPTGSMVMWYTASPPTGWLFCDGDTFDAGTYPALNTLLGGNTLPDLQGNVPVGQDSGTFSTLGDTGGAETHPLTEAELAAHTHFTAAATAVTGSLVSASDQVARESNVEHFADYQLQGTSIAATVGISSSVGLGTAHQNLQPYRVVNFIIKT